MNKELEEFHKLTHKVGGPNEVLTLAVLAVAMQLDRLNENIEEMRKIGGPLNEITWRNIIRGK